MASQGIMLKKFHVNSQGEVSGAKKGLNAFLEDVCKHCCQNSSSAAQGGAGAPGLGSYGGAAAPGWADPGLGLPGDGAAVAVGSLLRGSTQPSPRGAVDLSVDEGLVPGWASPAGHDLWKKKKTGGSECSWIPAKVKSKCSADVVGQSGCDGFLQSLTHWLQQRILPVSGVCIGVVFIEIVAIGFALRLVSPWCCSMACLCCCCKRGGGSDDSDDSDFEDDYRSRRGSRKGGKRGRGGGKGSKRSSGRRNSRRRASTSSGFY